MFIYFDRLGYFLQYYYNLSYQNSSTSAINYYVTIIAFMKSQYFKINTFYVIFNQSKQVKNLIIDVE